MPSGEYTGRSVDLIAFYRLPELLTRTNDFVDEAGIAPWSRVRGGRQNFVGHNQPIEPRDLGYYEPGEFDTLLRQARLAKEYGIRGFCFIIHGQSPRQGLGFPLDDMLANDKICLDFCICWANDLSRADKADHIPQRETDLDCGRHFIDAALKYMRDSRYIRIEGRPIILISRPDILADCKEIILHWKSVTRAAGMGELYVCAVEYGQIYDELAFDAVIEFPPHKYFLQMPTGLTPVTLLNRDFSGSVFDYKVVRDWFFANCESQALTRFRGVTPSWDNTALLQDKSCVLLGSTPLLYQEWLYWSGLESLLVHPPGRRFVFINAWNDWISGCMLEPDKTHGLQYLQATHNAVHAFNDRLLVFEYYRSALETTPFHSQRISSAMSAIIMNYERSIAGMMRIMSEQRKPDVAELLRTISVSTLGDAYFRRLGSKQPDGGLDKLFAAVPIWSLSKAYLARLKLAIDRRLRALLR